MGFGLIVIGDEILSGRREDKHMRKAIELLNARGLALNWAEYIGDERDRITATLRRTFASSDIVFCTGGIGATPDDHTRQCAAAALGVELALHPDAREQIALRIAESAEGDPVKADLNRPENQHRFKMGEFPVGARIIPNSYNRIPGFSVADHHFMPGFPVMAWPMMEWVLDHYYAPLFHRDAEQARAFYVFEAPESTLTPLMEQVEAAYPGIRVFSLPSVGDVSRGDRFARRHIDLGVKGLAESVPAAYAMLFEGVRAMGFEIVEQ
ncbi:MAG: competence/damage-inducible protein A [Cupriavidus sp.]|jgi:molybdopterin-biosynthesis enzyme MoeA-like protein|uniref:competence/damage-inducible protein A n=1 Tax=Cupriavidus pauculus TaxID=82633 RepID=UPI0007838993|nr:molybdopterin-binding protein [Cupriavidus pauculus]MBU68469.1 competence/damage-inducible protein A [Cupriavidus sp.]KAB0599997.1 competence/damage-inducible protein A [Cupriavidus pauculus]MBY4730570.1 competence/damage-inducible protein A [Cupriavidus pauculus]MCM3607962.1 molybdopterin-binding protein [Cupriavidus pauculus]UAK99849.1 competence/damage-inducible protein A [Cupriavidus pauculus]